MKTKSTWTLPLLTIACALVFTSAAQATVVSFTVDTTGTANGGAEIAPTIANQTKYNAGSWMSLSGNLSAAGASGNFATQSGAGVSGSFPAGNPGSLTSFFNGTLLADVDLSNPSPTTISFPGGSTLNAGLYNAKFPPVANAVQNLTPAIGGGTIGGPAGADPANFGVAITLKLIGIITVASGTAALRDSVYDVAQTVPASSAALSSIGGGSYNFPTSGNLSIAQPQGNIDYNLIGSSTAIPNLAGTGSIGSPTLTPMTDGLGTLTVVNLGGNLRKLFLTVPIKATIAQTITGSTPATINLTVQGTMAAFAIVTVPEPATMTMLGVGLSALIPLAWYRRRKRAA